MISEGDGLGKGEREPGRIVRKGSGCNDEDQLARERVKNKQTNKTRAEGAALERPWL